VVNVFTGVVRQSAVRGEKSECRLFPFLFLVTFSFFPSHLFLAFHFFSPTFLAKQFGLAVGTPSRKIPKCRRSWQCRPEGLHLHLTTPLYVVIDLKFYIEYTE